VHARRRRHRLQDGADDDDGRDGVEEAATTRNTPAMKKPAPMTPMFQVDTPASSARDLVEGEQPAEGAGGADAEQGDGGEAAPFR
jgi:hypothetical protein